MSWEDGASAMATKKNSVRPYLGELRGVLEQVPSLDQSEQYAFSNNALATQFNLIVHELAGILGRDLSRFLADATFEPLPTLRTKLSSLIGRLEYEFFPEMLSSNSPATNVVVNSSNSVNLAMTMVVKNDLIAAIDKELETLNENDPAKGVFQKIKERVKKAVGLDDLVAIVVGLAKGAF